MWFRPNVSNLQNNQLYKNNVQKLKEKFGRELVNSVISCCENGTLHYIPVKPLLRIVQYIALKEIIMIISGWNWISCWKWLKNINCLQDCKAMIWHLSSELTQRQITELSSERNVDFLSLTIDGSDIAKKKLICKGELFYLHTSLTKFYHGISFLHTLHNSLYSKLFHVLLRCMLSVMNSSGIMITEIGDMYP